MGMVMEPLREVDVTFDGDRGPLLGGTSDVVGEESAPKPDLPLPRISFGAAVVPLRPTTRGLDPAVAAEIESLRDTSVFSVIRLVASMRPVGSGSLDEIRIGVNLEPEGFAAEPPTAWSMTPLRLVSEYKPPFSVEGGIEIPLVVGVKLGGTYEPDTREEWWLLGNGELQSTADWTLRRTKKVDLDAQKPLLTMVVRQPPRVACRARVVMTGTVRTGALFWRQEATLPRDLRTLALPATGSA